MRILSGFLTVILLAAFCGCGDGPPSLDGSSISTVPAKGTVKKKDGTPITEGIITLEPLLDGGSTNQATGEIKSDGTFELRSSSSKTGAMLGKYRVRLESKQVKLPVKADSELTVEVKSGEDLNIVIP